MFGAGGSALVAKTLGEGDRNKANKYFLLVVYVSIAVGLIISILGIVFMRPVMSLLGAEGEMLDNCVIYGRIILIAMVPFMIQMEMQSFFITAERPNLGLWVTVASGVTNMVLDALLVGIIPLGLSGAALATAISQAVGGFVPIL
jgi:Na+-driven multidrug efflux pump